MNKWTLLAGMAAATLSLARGAAAVDSDINVSVYGGDAQLPTPLGSDGGWVATPPLYPTPGAANAWGDPGVYNGYGWGGNPNGTGTTGVIRVAAPGTRYTAAQYNLTGMTTATLSGTFRIRSVNNGGWTWNSIWNRLDAGGLPLLSLELGYGVGVSLSIVNMSTNTTHGIPAGDVADDSYHYQLIQYDNGSDPRNLLADVAVAFPPGDSHNNGEANLHTASLRLDQATKHVKLIFDGGTKYDSTVSSVMPSGVNNYAFWGAATAAQPVPGNAELRVFWEDIHLLADATPMPASELANGDFDTGGVAPWTIFNTTSTGYTPSPVVESAAQIASNICVPSPNTTSGGYALAAQYTSNYEGADAGAYQLVSVTPGVRYTLSGDVAGCAGGFDDGVNPVFPTADLIWQVGLMDGGWDPNLLNDPNSMAFQQHQTVASGGWPWMHFSKDFTPLSNTVAVYVRYRAWNEAWNYNYFAAFFDSLALVNPTNVACGGRLIWADADGDGDVDMDDFADFQLCYTDDAGTIPTDILGGTCICYDHNLDVNHQVAPDGVINAADFVQFMNCTTGPGIPWSPALTPNCVP